MSVTWETINAWKKMAFELKEGLQIGTFMDHPETRKIEPQFFLQYLIWAANQTITRQEEHNLLGFHPPAKRRSYASFPHSYDPDHLCREIIKYCRNLIGRREAAISQGFDLDISTARDLVRINEQISSALRRTNIGWTRSFCDSVEVAALLACEEDPSKGPEILFVSKLVMNAHTRSVRAEFLRKDEAAKRVYQSQRMYGRLPDPIQLPSMEKMASEQTRWLSFRLLEYAAQKVVTLDTLEGWRIEGEEGLF